MVDVQLPEFSWPWAVAVVGMLVTVLKGLERMWLTARAVERVESTGERVLKKITAVEEKMGQHLLDSAEFTGRIDTRLSEGERRIKEMEDKWSRRSTG